MDPVLCVFDFDVQQTELQSTEDAWVILPLYAPTVVANRFVLPTWLLAILILMVESENQTVLSDPVCKDTDFGENRVEPILLQYSVIKSDPVLAIFIRLARLTEAVEDERHCDELEVFKPAEIITFWVRYIPCPLRQKTEESEAQIVVSLGVGPV